MLREGGEGKICLGWEWGACHSLVVEKGRERISERGWWEKGAWENICVGIKWGASVTFWLLRREGREDLQWDAEEEGKFYRSRQLRDLKPEPLGGKGIICL